MKKELSTPAPVDLEELRAVAEKTPDDGPLRFDDNDRLGWRVYGGGFPNEGYDHYFLVASCPSPLAAEFIATFDPPTVLALIARLTHLERIAGRAKRVVVTRNDPACNRKDVDLAIEALAALLDPSPADPKGQS